MDIYQISDLMNGMSSNLTQQNAVFITVLTAYLVVVYSVGKNLTRYQVTFISTTFSLLTLLGTSGQLRNLEVITEWAEQAVALKSDEAAVSDVQVAISMWLFMGTRVALILGALVFMWQVRHPKTE